MSWRALPESRVDGPMPRQHTALRRRTARPESGRNAPGAVSARRRRMLAKWLRLTAARPRDRVRPARLEVLLYDRAAAVRSELLEIADLLERTHDPDPACVASLHELLRNGCDSPLYNAEVHESELRATLYYARRALLETSPEQR